MISIISLVFLMMVVKIGGNLSQKIINITMIYVRLLMLFHIQDKLMTAIIDMSRKLKWQMPL